MTEEPTSTNETIELHPTVDPILAKLNFLKRFWNGFHNIIIVALISSTIGAYVCYVKCKDYYSGKTEESISAGAMIYNKKLYVIQPKL